MLLVDISYIAFYGDYYLLAVSNYTKIPTPSPSFSVSPSLSMTLSPSSIVEPTRTPTQTPASEMIKFYYPGTDEGLSTSQ